jgi:hypothetical protein
VKIIGCWRRGWWMAMALGAMAILLPMQGCGGGRAAENPFQRGETDERVVMRVENRNILDARIFIRPRGRRTLLTTIQARELRFLEFGWPRGLPLDLEVELGAGGRFRPPPLPMTPGMRVELIIASEVRQSILRQ